MTKKELIKSKKNIVIKIFKIIILGIIVLTFFLLKIPFFFLKVIYNVFSLKCNKKVYEVLYDNHNYDFRAWYLQYIDKGFSFLFTSSQKLKTPDNYNFISEKKRIYIPFKWYLEIQFRRIFLLQKYLFINLLYHLWFVLFKKKYLNLYVYSFLTILRLTFGEFVIKNLDNRKKKIINIFVILINKLFDEDPILKEIKSNYNLKKKIKNYLIKLFIKLKISFIIFTKTLYIFIIKYFIINIYKVFVKIIYILKLSNLIRINFYKYMIKKRKKKEKTTRKENTKRDFALLYLYKPDIFKLHLKQKDDRYKANLDEKLLNIVNINNIKLKKYDYNKTKRKLINKELIFKFKLYQIRWKLKFLNAKNFSFQAFSNLKTYSDWIIYRYRVIEKIIFKKTMKQLIWTKDYESSFSIDVEWDLFLVGDNLLYTFLKDLKYIWEDPSKKYLGEIYKIYFHWSLIKLPYRDFIDSFLRKSLLNQFIKKHVLSVNKWVEHFNNETLVYISQNFLDKEIIALLYDNFYYYIMWTFENYNNTNQSLQKRILDYFKNDFKSLRTNFEELKQILEIEEIEKKFVETKIKRHKVLKKQITNIIKGDLFKFSSYYENDFFMFKWIKFYGLKWFDFELYDKKILKISKTMSKNLINSNFYLNNTWFESFNIKIFKKVQSNIIYKLLEKKNGIMPFFFSNANLRNKWIIWSSKMSNTLDWVSKKKKSLKFFRKLKKEYKEKKINEFDFCINILKYMYMKTFKLRNLRVLTFILSEARKRYLKVYKNKSKIEIIEIELKKIEIFDLIDVNISIKDLFYYICTMYKYNKIKGIFKVIFDIILLITILIIKKIINYIKK